MYVDVDVGSSSMLEKCWCLCRCRGCSMVENGWLVYVDGPLVASQLWGEAGFGEPSGEDEYDGYRLAHHMYSRRGEC